MAQNGFTPIQLYRSSTAAAVPLAADLVAGELAINTTDEKLYFENASGVVKLLASSAFVGTVTSVNASGGTTGMTFSGGPITSSGTLTLSGTLAVANGGTGVTTSTGTTSVVLSNTPTLVTPILGAASATSIANGLGAVGTPSYTFTGDLNTGMFSPSADAIALGTAGSERVRIDSAGNVGIGTSAPIYQAQVRGLGQDTANLTDAGNKGGSLYLQANGVTDGSGGALLFGTTFGNQTPFAAIKGLVTDGSGNTVGDLCFSTRNNVADTALTERLRVTAIGNVGIGTSSPSAKLEISGDVRVGSGGDVRVSSATGTTTSAGDSVIFNDANNMIFGTGTTTAERMRIDSNGNVGIGISSPSLKLQVNGASGSSQVLDVTNTSAGASLGGIVCSINAGGNNTNSFHFLGVTQTVAVYQLFGNGTTSYTSDIRVKKNVETTRDGYLDDICKLRVVKYNWYNDAEDTPRELGFIAQEVEQVFPGLVQDALYPTKDGICHKVLKGSVMMPIMLKALQEANEKIDALSARLAQLETSAATIKFTGN